VLTASCCGISGRRWPASGVGNAGMTSDKRHNLRALQAFEAVARHSSITKAADELGVTQSAVSHQLRKLSDDIGERLVVKSGRQVILTEAGRRLGIALQAAFLQIDRSVIRPRREVQVEC